MSRTQNHPALPATIGAALAAEHVRDLHRAGAQGRLAAAARCCRESWLARAGSHARAGRDRAALWVRRGQLGPAANYCACP